MKAKETEIGSNEGKAVETKQTAESEKIKGNDYMGSKDFKLALNHYSNSIKLNPSEPTTYSNRGLCYFKLKSKPLNRLRKGRRRLFQGH